ncbi:ABC transporter ATP-binding protein [Chloroflexota bacterium]
MTEERYHTTPEWAIHARGITKLFGSHFALRGVDLEIGDGESVVIFGPNGAGKTTLIKVLATIMNPSSGRITVAGQALKRDAEEIRRRIGVVTHHTFLYNNLTAYENLEFYCRMYDVPRVKERIGEVVSMVQMASRLNDRVGILSRGMQQRLSIARALLHKPTIILLDEPETGLDQEAVPLLWGALEIEERKPTIVLTTHNLERGLHLGQRILILARGKVVCQMSTEDLELDDLKQTYQHATAGRP